MSIDDPLVVDMVNSDPESGRVLLTISDHYEWDSSTLMEHAVLLERKTASYVDFIESGQLEESYPDARGREIEIQLVCRVMPTEERAVKLLGAIRGALADRGIRFSSVLLPREYSMEYPSD